MITNQSGGSRATNSMVRLHRRASRKDANPHGRDLGGVWDAMRQSEKHPYIRSVIVTDTYKAVLLQLDEQAALAATQGVFMADTTFKVVAPGSAKEGIPLEAIATAGKYAHDWHHFSVRYVHAGHTCVFCRLSFLHRC